MQENFNLYYQFIISALLGDNPSKTDVFFKKYKDNILSIANMLKSKLPLPQSLLYRGIILEDKNIINNKLKPLSYITYLSFTENLKIAENFADINSWMACTIMNKRPESKGYIIEYKPIKEEILFYWKWYEILKLNEIPILNVSLIKSHEEVIIMQTNKIFKLNKMDK